MTGTYNGGMLAQSCVCCGSSDLAKSPAILMPFVAHRVFDWAPVEITKDWGLRTITPGMAYSICNSVLCADCRHLFLDIRFSDTEMAALYAGYRDERYTALREHYEPGYRARNARLNAGYQYIPDIESFIAPHVSFPLAILDWGGDTGHNTPFKDRARLFHVYDISEVPVIAGAVQVAKDATRSVDYDLVVCSHVLEHVPFPQREVADIRKSMRDDTVLYIEVPFEELVRTSGDDAGLHRRKKHWHEHVNFYNERSLARMVEACGLEVHALQPLKTSAAAEGSGYVLQAVCKPATS
jgi:hypothetical protein